MQQRKGISLAPPGVSRVEVGGGVGMDGAGRGAGVWGQRDIGFPGWEARECLQRAERTHMSQNGRFPRPRQESNWVLKADPGARTQSVGAEGKEAFVERVWTGRKL